MVVGWCLPDEVYGLMSMGLVALLVVNSLASVSIEYGVLASKQSESVGKSFPKAPGVLWQCSGANLQIVSTEDDISGRSIKQHLIGWPSNNLEIEGACGVSHSKWGEIKGECRSGQRICDERLGLGNSEPSVTGVCNSERQVRKGMASHSEV